MNELVSIITCSAVSDDVTILRNSMIRRLHYNYKPDIICTVGESAITKAYNKGVQKAKGDVFIFTHEDVELWATDYDLIQAIRIVSNEDGVLGVAGSKRLPKTACWWQEASDNSGGCAHTKDGEVWLSSFGKYGEVEVLDGVFLMCSRRTFECLNGFDETIPAFDFYDIDFTLRSSQMGFVNRTYPLMLCHHSLGEGALKNQWEENRQMIVKRIEGGYYR